MKKLPLTIVVSAIATSAWSQPAESSFLADPMLPVYAIAAALILVLLIVVFVGVYAIRTINLLADQAERLKAGKSGAQYQERASWWSRLMEKMNASVPVESEKEIELDHSYDGIRELDNHLPPWWKWLFYATIAFSVVYMIVYHISGTLPLQHDEYRRELAMADEQVRLYRASQPQAVIDENKLEYTADPVAIEKGKNIFLSNACGGCHRNDGGGNTIGPNLTDHYWLHGGDVKSVFATIRDGVVEKGMPAWGKSMSAEDVKNVTFFVISLRGTNPPDAKAPQGELEEQVPLASDTIKTAQN